jgi:polyphosphate kinase
MANKEKLTAERYFDRDISWLSFNERVLAEAANPEVPLYERLKFLAIYSSNLDEFYRVRIASLIALSKLNKERKMRLSEINIVIENHQNQYGQVLRRDLIPALRQQGIEFLYNVELPDTLTQSLSDIFYTKVAAFLHVERLSRNTTLFPRNNKLFLTVSLQDHDDIFVINIPSDNLSRFWTINADGKTFVVMIDDIIRHHVSALFGGAPTGDAYSFKVTRDAELSLSDDMSVGHAAQLEKRLAEREFGFATRLLHDANMPEYMLNKIVKTFKLGGATMMAGGRYHNLRDFFSFPRGKPSLYYDERRPVNVSIPASSTLFSTIAYGDLMLHTPYHSYDLVLRFFAEAAIDPSVNKIYVTLYRIAEDSVIAQSLITAARNGKMVCVLVELKARFDEANNLRWASKMKEAGVIILYSGARMKVHAKIALVSRTEGHETNQYGLLATGNFNENTARLYTDHILLTSHRKMLDEVLDLFKILIRDSKQPKAGRKVFRGLIVAPFNIRERFFRLIDREIDFARKGQLAAITIKLNNLEEETLIDKLYEASAAGVRIVLIVRSICRLIPQAPGLSENIHVRRIVDRYLEHGRIFIFHNNGNEEIYCGSADWMNRNIYHRIEVCFPIYDASIRRQLREIIDLQCRDCVKAVSIDKDMNSSPVTSTYAEKVRSQYAVYDWIAAGKNQDGDG